MWSFRINFVSASTQASSCHLFAWTFVNHFFQLKDRNTYISLTMPNCRYFKTRGDSLKKVSHEKDQESKVVSVDRTPFKGGRATVNLFKELPMCYDTFRR